MKAKQHKHLRDSDFKSESPILQQVFDRFKSFQEERKLSMSQAGIVIIAEYFGIEETIKEITEGTTVGGVTLAEFEKLKQRLEQLERQVEQSKTTSKLPIKNQSIDKLIKDEPNNLSEQQSNQSSASLT
jgi:hypothetical protein